MAIIVCHELLLKHETCSVMRYSVYPGSQLTYNMNEDNATFCKGPRLRKIKPPHIERIERNEQCWRSGPFKEEKQPRILCYVTGRLGKWPFGRNELNQLRHPETEPHVLPWGGFALSHAAPGGDPPVSCLVTRCWKGCTFSEGPRLRKMNPPRIERIERIEHSVGQCRLFRGKHDPNIVFQVMNDQSFGSQDRA